MTLDIFFDDIHDFLGIGSSGQYDVIFWLIACTIALIVFRRK